MDATGPRESPPTFSPPTVTDELADPEDELDPVERMAEEYLGRIRRGETPSIGEYVARQPEHAEVIRELFAALRLVEELKSDSGVITDAFSGPIRAGRVGRFELIARI